MSGSISLNRPNMDLDQRPFVFCGSSIIALWESLPGSLAGRPVLNTAISGSQTADLLPRLDELVIRHNPLGLCYYCGSNDINNEVAPAQIAANVRETAAILRAALPDLRFTYLAIIKAPQKQARWDQVDAVNRAIERFAADSPGCACLDINPLFFDPSGAARMDFYVEDQLHLTPRAYAALEAWLLPRLVEQLL